MPGTEMGCLDMYGEPICNGDLLRSDDNKRTYRVIFDPKLGWNLINIAGTPPPPVDFDYSQYYRLETWMTPQDWLEIQRDMEQVERDMNGQE